MSQGSSNPASPSRPVLASEQQETITPVSHVFSLSEVSASLEALNIEVERMDQTIIRMIGKLEQDRGAHWSEHLPEMLAAYNGTRSAVTGYSPCFLLFGRKSRMPVDCLFPTLRDSPHQAKMEVSVAAMQKRLKGTSPLRKLPGKGVIMIAKLELLPYSLETLSWFAPMALWARER